MEGYKKAKAVGTSFFLVSQLRGWGSIEPTVVGEPSGEGRRHREGRSPWVREGDMPGVRTLGGQVRTVALCY